MNRLVKVREIPVNLTVNLIVLCCNLLASTLCMLQKLNPGYVQTNIPVKCIVPITYIFFQSIPQPRNALNKIRLMR